MVHGLKEAGWTINETVMVLIAMPTAIRSRGTGTSIKDMDMGCTHTQKLDRVTEECGKLERRKGLGILSTRIISSLVRKVLRLFNYVHIHAFYFISNCFISKSVLDMTKT